MIASDAVPRRPVVFAFAETRAGPQGQQSATRKALSLGYKTWWWIASTPVPRRGSACHAYRGGVCVGVRQSVACSLASMWSHRQGELVSLEFGSFSLTAGWRRPQEEHDVFDSELGTLSLAAASRGCSVLVLGDFNDTPEETPLPDLGLFIHAPRDSHGWIPSRCKGTRAIGWLACNDSMPGDAHQRP